MAAAYRRTSRTRGEVCPLDRSLLMDDPNLKELGQDPGDISTIEE
jgi:hypothetical protein